MQKLTKAEEDAMQWLWALESATISQILEAMPEELRPPQSTLSSFVRILERKGFVGHRAYGKVHEYFPLVSKEEYGRRSLSELLVDYFDGSAARLVSHLVKDEKLSPSEVEALLKKLDG